MRGCNINRIANAVAPWLCFAGISVAGFAQSQPTKAAFEAARVKPTAPTGGLARRGRMNGGPGTADPGRIDYQSIMLRSLLAERFKLAAHFESKITPVYELAVAKGGPKFKAWTAEDDRRLAEAKATAPSTSAFDGDGYPLRPAYVTYSWADSHARMNGIEEVMPNFAEFLGHRRSTCS